MHKIATPQDFQAELRQLLVYSQTERPSRQVLASRLNALADKVAAGETKTFAKFEVAYRKYFDVRSDLVKAIGDVQEVLLGDGSKYALKLVDLLDAWNEPDPHEDNLIQSFNAVNKYFGRRTM